MPYTPVQFESSRAKDQIRQDLRKAREKALEQVRVILFYLFTYVEYLNFLSLLGRKSRYKRKAAEEERARERGDDKWMLPSMEERYSQKILPKRARNTRGTKSTRKRRRKASLCKCLL